MRATIHGLIIVVGCLSIASVAQAASAKRAISSTSGVFLNIGNRFNGRPVSCRLVSNGSFEAGYKTIEHRRSYWNPIGPLIARQPLRRRTAFKNQLPRLAAKCQQRAKSTCRLTLRPATVRFTNLSPAHFALSFSNSCKLPVTVEQLAQPVHGSISGTPGNMTYTPREAGRFVDTVRMRLVARLKSSSSAEYSFAGNLSSSCIPTLSDTHIAVVENTPIDFVPQVINSCNLPLTFIKINDPHHGVLTTGDGTLSYTPDMHYLAEDNANIQVQNAAGTSATMALTFSVAPRTAEFAGDPNSLLPYREQLTKNEVYSLLRRVGGGTAQQRSLRSLTSLVDSMLVDTEAPETVAFRQALESERRARVSRSDSNIRWYENDIKRINIQAMRYDGSLRSWMAYNFWMNHFATDIYQQAGGTYDEAMLDHVMTIRNNAFGSFDTLTKALVSKPLLNTYLDSLYNTNATPNQNFARELMELFTAGSFDPITGEANYNEHDVEAATLFTAGQNWYENALGLRPIQTGLATPDLFDVSNDDAPVAAAESRCDWQTPNRVQLRWAITYGTGTHTRIWRAPLGSTSFVIVTDLVGSPWVYQDAPACGSITRTQPPPVAGQVYQYKIQYITKDSSGNVTTAGPMSNIATGYFGALNLPAIPANQTASTDLPDRIKLSWSPVSGASSYRIYRVSFADYLDDQMIAEVSAATTSYDDLSVFPNKVYAYYIRALNSTSRLASSHPVRFIAYTATSSVSGMALSPSAPNLEAPTSLRATTSDAQSITVSWDPVIGAAGYRVFVTRAWLPHWLAVADVTNATTYVDTTSALSHHRHYRIVPFDSAGRLSNFAGAIKQIDSRYLQNVKAYNSSGALIQDDLLRPKGFFLDWLPDGHPNASAKILGPTGDGDSYSMYGRPVMERINWQSHLAPTKSFLDHLLYVFPASSRNIAAKLFGSLAHRHLSEGIVSELASDLRISHYDIHSALRKILMSSAAFAPEADGTCVMNPTEVIMTFLRMADLPLTSTNSLMTVFNVLDSASHDVAAPHSVFGSQNCGLTRSGVTYDGSTWLASSQTYVALGNGISTILKQLTASPASSAKGEGISLLNTFVPTAVQTADGVIDAIADKLGIILNQGEHAALVEYLNKNKDGASDPWRRSLNSTDQSERLGGTIRLMVLSEPFLNK